MHIPKVSSPSPLRRVTHGPELEEIVFNMQEFRFRGRSKIPFGIRDEFDRPRQLPAYIDRVQMVNKGLVRLEGWFQTGQSNHLDRGRIDNYDLRRPAGQFMLVDAQTTPNSPCQCDRRVVAMEWKFCPDCGGRIAPNRR